LPIKKEYWQQFGLKQRKIMSMFENLTKKIAQSDDTYRCLSATPIFLVVGLILMYTAIQRPLPNKAELLPFNAVISDLDNNSGMVSIGGNTEKLRFPCMCDYGWGYKAFDSSAEIHALVYRNSDAELFAWELSIDDTSIFTYEELYSARKQEKDEGIKFASYTILGSVIGICFYIIAYVMRRRIVKKKEPEIS
jgi:hypothetical protein